LLPTVENVSYVWPCKLHWSEGCVSPPGNIAAPTSSKPWNICCHWSSTYGDWKPFAVNWRTDRSVRTRDVEERVLGRVEDNPAVRARQVVEELNAAQMTAWRVLHEHLLYPHHLQ
jgi:hypothetical protein